MTVASFALIQAMRLPVIQYLTFTVTLLFFYPGGAAEIESHEAIPFASPDGVELLLDLHIPSGVENPPLVMFVHGGGWRGGNRNNCRLEWVAEHGYAVASIEYRMSQDGIST